MKIEVETNIFSHSIEQITTIRDYNESKAEISRVVINLQESGIKEALIKMGWTPPSNEVNK